MASNFPPPFDDDQLKSLAQRVEEFRADLIDRYQRALRETLFTARSELRPGDVTRIAVGQADALINSLRNSLSFAREHGAGLSEMGLSRQAFFGLLWAMREFFISHFYNDFDALNAYASYRIMALDGFLESNEKRILNEQEGIRRAFRIALDHSMEKIRASEERYRTLVEISPYMVALVNLQDEIIMMNKTGVELFGYQTEAEVIGRNMWSFIVASERSLAERLAQEAFAEGQGRNIQLTAVRKDGTTFDAEFGGSVILNSAGSVQSVMIVGSDITIRKQTERFLEREVRNATAKLRSTSERLTELLERSPAMIYAARLDDGFSTTFISENVREYLGYASECFTDDRDFMFNNIHPQDVGRVRSELKNILDDGILVLEYRFRHQNGEYRWLRDALRLVRSKEGELVEIVGSMVDITKRKLSEEALQESEERANTILNEMLDGFWTVDTQGRIRGANPAICRMLGYTQEELLEMSISDVEAKETPDETAEHIQDIVRNGSSRFETMLRRKDGSVIDVDLSVIYVQKHGLFFSFHRDITERKQIEESLRESEWRNRVVSELTTDSIFVADVGSDGIIKIRWVSGNIFRIIDQTIDEVGTSDMWGNIIYPADRVGFYEYMNKVISTIEADEMECRVFHKEGEIRWVRIFAQPQVDLENHTITIIGALKDITEHKQMEITLRTSEEKFAKSFHASRMSLSLARLKDFQLLEVNDATLNLTGFTRDEIIGHTADELAAWVNPTDRQEVIRALIAEGEVSDREYLFRSKRGEILVGQYSAFVIDIAGEKCILVSIHDITRRKRAEEALRESEERYRNLAEASQDMIFIIDRNDRILYINTYIARQFHLNVDEIVGKPRSRLFLRQQDEQQAASLQKVFETGEPLSAENEYTFPDRRMALSTWLVPLTDSAGNVTSVMGVSRDITELKQLERELRESQETLRVMFDSINSSIALMDSQNVILATNQIAAQRLGMSVDDMVGLSIYDVFPPKIAEERGAWIKRVFSTGAPVHFEDNRDGFWYRSDLFPLYDGNGKVDRVVAIATDVTDLKNMQQHLQEMNEQLEKRVAERTDDLVKSHERLRQLAHQVVTAQEEERKRISRELHDEAGQVLIGLRLSLDTVKKELPGNLRTLRRRMSKAVESTNETIRMIRRLAYSLRPPALDLIGLHGGIQELCEEFSEHTSIKVEYHGMHLEGVHDEVSISLYRFVQESLTNVAKHAQANKVWVDLDVQDGIIKASVRDNGSGIDSGMISDGIGLEGIKERFNILDGKVEIVSLKGKEKGTQISVTLPWKIIDNDAEI